MGEEIEVHLTVRKGREVRKKKFVRYLPGYKSFSRFFEDLKAEIDTILEEILRR